MLQIYVIDIEEEEKIKKEKGIMGERGDLGLVFGIWLYCLDGFSLIDDSF